MRNGHPSCNTKLVLAIILLLITQLLLPLNLTTERYIGNKMNPECPDFSVSCINVNSLNMSSSNKPVQLKKIFGIAKLRTDIIFLSDVRISNRNLVSSKNDLVSIFRNNIYGSYSAYFNSTSNKRGVGILINNKIPFSVEAEIRDEAENYLLLRLQVKGNCYIVGAIYGPNSTDENFFTSLERDLNILGHHPTIVGGDWNATYCDLPVDLNIDCLNMRNLPNLLHSQVLRGMCNRNSLIDPFRNLYPTLENFTYVPRNVAAGNKSRIDYFLISDSLLNHVQDCYIADSLQSKLFDHKAVFLCFRNSSRNRKLPSISNKIINDPYLESLIDIITKETYITYQVRAEEDKRNLFLIIGRALEAFRNLKPNSSFYRLSSSPADEESQALVANRVNNLRLDDRIEIDTEIRLTIDEDLFFEVLLNNIKNEVISYQSYVFRAIRDRKDQLSASLKVFLNSENKDMLLINNIESELQKISEREIELALENHPVFEHLNGEKMSPNFLRLAKGKTDPADLSHIKNDNNENFISDIQRRDYIVNYFSSIYQVPDGAPEAFDGLIEEFLGPEICNHPVVLGSKLTVNEARDLEADLDIGDLDKSVLDCKVRTAPGLDGFNNSFIKKYWKFFRHPLLKYSHTCFRKGRLTDSFRTGSIKLIPKKGDTSKIKNWRPISLLNCFYKIISRAINYRLQSFCDRIMSRAQKGFTPSRYLHEVVLNISGNMEYCKSNNISGAIVAIDQAKAFDTIFHGFVNAAYKFFGVGERFLNMLNTLGTGRRAQIILEDNIVSNSFPLGTGRPQGGNLSPLEFNAGEQVLIFKIELDDTFASIFRDSNVPRSLFPVPVNNISRDFFLESNGETDKADGFADDTYVSMLLELESLSYLKITLVEFARISGLKCNFEKTNVLPIGNIPDNLDFVQEVGFSVTQELTMLGFKINRNGILVDDMFNKVLRNIASIILSWDRYRLSLPGRIGICKTLCISQISFPGSICSPPVPVLNRIQSLIDNYVIGNLKVAKDRLYRPASEGGLGLINVKSFISGIQSSWVKRAHLSSRDNWRVDLRSLCYGNCYTLGPNLVNLGHNPIFRDIADSFSNFITSFYKKDGNFKDSYVFNNPLIRRGLGDNRLLDFNFFSHNIPRLDMARVTRLRFCDFFENGIFKSLDRLNDSTGTPFSLTTYLRLSTALHYFMRVNRSNFNEKSCRVEDFLRVKKGEARKMRLVIDSNHQLNKSLYSLTSVKTFFRLIGTTHEEPHNDDIFSFWNEHYLCNKLRDFCYKYFYNLLPLNVRLSHYVQNVGRGCTFCTLSRREDINIPDETFLHLFLDCPTTSRIHDWFLNKYYLGLNIDRVLKLNYFFLGVTPGTGTGTGTFNKFGFAMAVTIQFLIWELKIQKRVLMPLSLDDDFIFLLGGNVKSSGKFAAQRQKISLINHGALGINP
jgi:exonuclease III